MVEPLLALSSMSLLCSVICLAVMMVFLDLLLV